MEALAVVTKLNHLDSRFFPDQIAHASVRIKCNGLCVCHNHRRRVSTSGMTPVVSACVQRNHLTFVRRVMSLIFSPAVGNWYELVSNPNLICLGTANFFKHCH